MTYPSTDAPAQEALGQVHLRRISAASRTVSRLYLGYISQIGALSDLALEASSNALPPPSDEVLLFLFLLSLF